VADRTDLRRFRGPSHGLSLDRLVRSRRLRIASGAIALALLALVSTIFEVTEEQRSVPKPLEMRLIIRQARMKDPFRLERAEIEKRTMTRKVTPAWPKVSSEPEIRREDLSGKTTSLRQEVDTGSDLHVEEMEPQPPRASLAIQKDPGSRRQRQLDMLDILDFDTGRYKGLLLPHPTNKQLVDGFVYLALAWGNDWGPATPRAIAELVEAINLRTRIRAEVDPHLDLGSAKIFRAPFIYMSVGDAFLPTKSELANFKEYLRRGGFALVENANPWMEYSPAEASLRQMLKDALGVYGRFRIIPKDHPIYHSFYDFDDGPPPAVRPAARTPEDLETFDIAAFQPDAPYLEGIFIDGRLAVVYSNKAYGTAWENEYRNEPQLRMGINMVVFALLQEGSMARRQMYEIMEMNQLR
jgi:hypothetical protein